MMPANNIFKAGWAGWAGRSSFGRLDQFVDGLRIVERFADREARAHAAIELAALQELFVTALRGDLSAVEDEDAVGVAYGRQAVRDHDRRPAGAQAPERGKHDLFG